MPSAVTVNLALRYTGQWRLRILQASAWAPLPVRRRLTRWAFARSVVQMRLGNGVWQDYSHFALIEHVDGTLTVTSTRDQ